MGRVIKNPDEVFVRNLRKRIKNNNGYCPCKDFREGRGCDCG